MELLIKKRYRKSDTVSLIYPNIFNKAGLFIALQYLFFYDIITV